MLGRKGKKEWKGVKKKCWWERLRSVYFTCITGRRWELWSWGDMMKWCHEWPADVWGSRGTAPRPPPLIICAGGEQTWRREDPGRSGAKLPIILHSPGECGPAPLWNVPNAPPCGRGRHNLGMRTMAAGYSRLC